MAWWIWVIVGFVLMLAELVVPGTFYIFFFGVGGIVVGLLVLAGVGGPDWMQWALFSAVSIASILFLRQPIVNRYRTPAVEIDTMVGEEAVALEDIPPGVMGKVEMRGSSWNARNVGSDALLKGQRCRVEHVDGLTVSVRGERKAATKEA
jgi:membrane protein implicated in regulation of membrane protease activity